MRLLNFCVLILLSSSLVACSGNEIEEFEDKTNSGQETPSQYPKAVGAWIEARTFMMKQDESNAGCDQIDFRVMANSGIYSVNRCDETKTGQLTPEEFKRLDEVTTQAYEQTEGTICPEIFRFNKFYATINATDDESDRNFDPDNNCFSGDGEVVKTFRDYLRQLLSKYQAATEGNEN